MLAFAPFRISHSNDRIQPVWYRIADVENGTLKSIRYVDSYHPFPPRLEYDSKLFYQDLANLKSDWGAKLSSAMRIDVPDERLEYMARFSLIRAIMTRIGNYPKYGVFDKDYGGSEHDGFPDTFPVETAAMLSWGLINRAGHYIDNYFGKFVRDDGSILYRGSRNWPIRPHAHGRRTVHKLRWQPRCPAAPTHSNRWSHRTSSSSAQ